MRLHAKVQVSLNSAQCNNILAAARVASRIAVTHPLLIRECEKELVASLCVL